MRLGKIYCSSQVKNSFDHFSKIPSTFTLGAGTRILAGDSRGVWVCLLPSPSCFAKVGAYGNRGAHCQTALMPLQKQQLVHLLGQKNKPSQARHWRGKSRWERGLKQHKRGTAQQPLLQPPHCSAGTISGCSPRGSQPHTCSIPAVAEPCVVHPDSRASQGSQMRSAWFHGGARFSENHGNYTCKKISEHQTWRHLCSFKSTPSHLP